MTLTTQDKIREVLCEIRGLKLKDSCACIIAPNITKCCYESECNQALTRILELVEKCVPEELKRDLGAKKLNNEKLTESDVLDDYRKFGYNQAIQDIRENIQKELVEKEKNDLSNK